MKREFFLHSSYSMRLAKRLWVSCCKASEHKGWVVPVWFRLCKGFYKDSGNLKWVAWVLDVGTGCGRTSIKLCLHSLFPYLIYVIAINFALHVYRTLLNWLLLLLLHSKPIPLKIIEATRSNKWYQSLSFIYYCFIFIFKLLHLN